MKKDKELKEIVKELISKYIRAKPRRIRLKANYSDDDSSISIKGNDLDETVEYQLSLATHSRILSSFRNSSSFFNTVVSISFSSFLILRVTFLNHCNLLYCFFPGGVLPFGQRTTRLS